MNKTWKRFVWPGKEQYCILFLAIVVIVGASNIYLENMETVTYHWYDLCMGDMLLLCWLPFFRCIVFVPVIMICIFLLSRYEVTVNKVIRYKNMKNVWRALVVQNTFYILTISFMISILIVGTNLNRIKEWINFQDRVSLCTFMLDGEILHNPPFIQVFLLFVAGMFLYAEMTGMCFLILWKWLDNCTIAFLVVYVWNILENYMIKTPVMFNRINIWYKCWTEGEFGIAASGLAILLLMMVGGRVMSRKELLDEQAVGKL